MKKNIIISEIPEQSQFSNKCGVEQPLETTEDIKQTTNTHPVHPHPVESPVVNKKHPPADGTDANKKSSSKRLKWIIISISVLLLISLILFLWLEVFTVRVFLLTEERNKELTGSSRYTYKYDSSGNLLKISSFLNDEKTGSIEFTYDRQGNLLEVYTESNSGMIDWTKYSYDSNGNLISCEYASGSYIEYTCDNNGNITGETEYNDLGNIVSYTQNTYNNGGNLIESSAYIGNIFSYHYVYEYDENGNQTEERSYNLDGDLIERTVMEYENGNKLIRKVSYFLAIGGQETEKYRLEYTYDEKGNLIKIFEYEAGGSAEQTFYEYDENGHLSMIHYGESSIYRKITCDKYGNPIKIVRYSSGEKTSTQHLEYKKIRVSKKRAYEIQEQYGVEEGSVIIDNGLF